MLTRPPALPWIHVAPGAPYFVDETGAAFTPIGHNEAISWVDLRGLAGRRDLPGVEAHLAGLAAEGVTVIRLMLECAHQRGWAIERPAGRFVPRIVAIWDDLFALCARHGLRILLTPVDTFWTWIRWPHHPWNRANGGPLDHPSRLLLCPETRAAIKRRLEFAAVRWGGSGALFAWDLWNEIHPAQAEDTAEPFAAFMADLAAHVRAVERRVHGRTHPVTVSLFGPELRWRPHLGLEEPIFRHPDMDFASIHIYREGSIDDPRDTVAAAVDTGEIVRVALAEIRDTRPFLDTEHGPIHAFKDKHRTLPEPFDDEYFRHMQWAHLASGAAGGGMRWPNRKVHRLTPGMRRAQRGLADFLPLIDWPAFRRRNLNAEIALSRRSLAAFACGDDRQAVVWLLRRDTIRPDGTLDPAAEPVSTRLAVPGLAPGRYSVRAWDTREGRPAGERAAEAGPYGLAVETPPFAADLALAITPA
ncbi:hypothetical protein [Prosthecomicrobium sp. N25]|uniref:hypothetical protein n=1 Tax=Prosthecomicrobium sp. N25 TaxID=3129254 RepID=UPI0030776403